MLHNVTRYNIAYMGPMGIIKIYWNLICQQLKEDSTFTHQSMVHLGIDHPPRMGFTLVSRRKGPIVLVQSCPWSWMIGRSGRWRKHAKTRNTSRDTWCYIYIYLFKFAKYTSSRHVALRRWWTSWFSVISHAGNGVNVCSHWRVEDLRPTTSWMTSI